MTSAFKATTTNGPQPLETWPLAQRMADAVLGGTKEILLTKEDLVKLFDAVIILSKYNTYSDKSDIKRSYVTNPNLCTKGGLHKLGINPDNFHDVFCVKCECRI